MCYSLRKEGSLGGGSKVALPQIIPSLVSYVGFADFGGLKVWRGGWDKFPFGNIKVDG